MRLTIFWRLALIQLILVVLILAVGFSVLSQVRQQNAIDADILMANAARMSEEQRLLNMFLLQRRNAEKYLLLRDPVFLEQFLRGSAEFNASLEKIASFMTTPEEETIVRQIRTLYARYSDGVTANGPLLETWRQERAEISDRLVTALRELLRLTEAANVHKIEQIGKRTLAAPAFLGWVFAGGLGLVAALLYFHAQSLSRPLQLLAREMEQIGQGAFNRSLRVQGPSEVADVLRVFNMMAARLAEIDEMQGDFLAQMSHELRTPLTAIQEGSSLLLEEIPGALNASQREIVQVVRSNSERLFRRLATILDLSKMEARKMEYSLVATDLVALVRKSVEAIGPIAQKKQLQVKFQTQTRLPVVYIDEDRIRQVLDNLLNNAVKFTPEQGVISVATAVRFSNERAERWVEVSVSDTGVGVPPEEAERIFHKFYQSSVSRGQAWRGSGLGLAISRHIVEAHGGKIWVESRPGEGATFIFTLPLRRTVVTG